MTARPLALAVLLAGTLSTPVLAQRSNTAGFHVGVFLNGSTAESEDSDEVESGGGASLLLGYGFNQRLSLFARLHAARIESEGLEDARYTLAHFDLGGRFSLGGAGAALRPFVQAAFSGRSASFDLGSEGVLDIRGSGLTGGGGVGYFVSPSLAIEGGVSFTIGEFNEGRLDDGAWGDLDDLAFEMNTTRFDLGLSWHP